MRVLPGCVAGALAVGALAVLAPRASADPDNSAVTPVSLDVINVAAARGLDRATVVAVEQAAVDVGAMTTIVHEGTIDMLRVRRNGVDIQVAPFGLAIPMTALAFDQNVIGATATAEVTKVLQRGDLVMGATTARLRGAQSGDVITVIGWNGGVYDLPIGLVAPDGDVGAELLLATPVAKAIGLDRPSSVRVWGMPDRTSFDAALTAHLKSGTLVKVRHSWDPAFPDDAISQSRTKELLGEFAVARGRKNGQLVQQASWQNANLVSTSLPIIGKVRCHQVVAAAARDALAEIFFSGLGGLINVRDTRRYGGCWNARELRTDTGSSGRNLSRHSWGAAIDINPSSNPFGRAPTMDPRIVEIFRRHGFLWGGSFTIPDGMHFEYVGEPRA